MSSFKYLEHSRIQKNSAVKLGGDLMFHKVKAVSALNEYILKITFQNGTEKFYDVGKLFF